MNIDGVLSEKEIVEMHNNLKNLLIISIDQQEKVKSTLWWTNFILVCNILLLCIMFILFL